jgi:segregation and condensation protein B
VETSNTLQAQVEALLFAAGRPIAIQQLAKLAKAAPADVEASVQALTEEYKNTKRGLSVMRQDDKVQMVTSPEQGATIEQFVKEEFTGPLSRAALETLAIIAYRGPIAKPEIDTIRGVNSAIMLRTLLIRGLVERRRSTKDARTYAYTLSFDFVRHLGVSQASELPNYEELRHNTVMERFAQSAESASMEPPISK